jgi:hypothetical protein
MDERVQVYINGPNYVHDPDTYGFEINTAGDITTIFDPRAIPLPPDLSPAEQRIVAQYCSVPPTSNEAYKELKRQANTWFDERYERQQKEDMAAARRARIYEERQQRLQARRAPVQANAAKLLADYNADVADITREYSEAKIEADTLIATAKAALQQAKLDAARIKAEAFVTYTKELRDVEASYQQRKAEAQAGLPESGEGQG